MKVRTQFTITLVLFGITLIAIAALILVTSRQVEQIHDREAIVQDIELGARELSYLSYDYLLHREGRQRTRWEKKFSSFSKALSGLRPDGPEQSALVDRIRANQRRLEAVFSDVVSTMNSMSATQGSEADMAFMRVSWSRIEAQNQATISEASQLVRMLEEQTERLRKRNVILIFALIAILGAFLLTNFITVHLHLLRAISDLQDGAAVIGSGNLDFVIIEKRNDEIGDLSRAFNRMTADLKSMTVSKADLESEVAERRKAEEEVRRSRDELEIRVQERTGELQMTNRAFREYAVKLERLNEELRDFAFIASHDLQEPVRKIQALGDMLKTRCGASLDERGKDCIMRMAGSARQMGALVQSLLEYSRLTTCLGLSERIDLSGIIREIVHEVKPTIERMDGQIEVGELPVIEADGAQIRHVFAHLISNSIKFSKIDEPPVIKVHGQNNRDYLKISVEDNGIGFDEGYLDRIFRPFQQLHEMKGQYEGTGIGLAICRKIVELHGGTITARSAPGVGSTFIVSLPSRSSNEGLA